ncbi:hypothetical protein G3E01_003251 [Salmonella enterica subsp. enterica]|nr:hypothetical protein [Salmonella enterica subsp. enterica]
MYQQQYVNKPVTQNEYLLVLRYRLECFTSELKTQTENLSRQLTKGGGFDDSNEFSHYTNQIQGLTENMNAVQALIDMENQNAVQNQMYSN